MQAAVAALPSNLGGQIDGAATRRSSPAGGSLRQATLSRPPRPSAAPAPRYAVPDRAAHSCAPAWLGLRRRPAPHPRRGDRQAARPGRQLPRAGNERIDCALNPLAARLGLDGE
jgi:hypothetical protein